MLPSLALDEVCLECGLDIDPCLPRVVSKVLDCSWHVMCAPPLLPEEGEHPRQNLRRHPRRYVNPKNQGNPAGPREGEAEESGMATLYELGWTLEEIAKERGINKATVKRHLERDGVEMRSPGKRTSGRTEMTAPV